MTNRYELIIYWSKEDDSFVVEVPESSQREWSRWESSDMDGQTREGETSGKKANQAVRDGQAKCGARREWSAWERCDMDSARQGEHREGANQPGSSSQLPGCMADGQTYAGMN